MEKRGNPARSILERLASLKFTGAEDYEKQTSFVLDDTALTTS